MKYSLRSLMKFSIRDLIWITVVVSLALGWWVDRGQYRQYRDSAAILTQLVEELEKRGVSVSRVGDHTVVVGPDSAMALPPIGNPTVSTAPTPPNSQAPAPNPPKD